MNTDKHINLLSHDDLQLVSVTKKSMWFDNVWILDQKTEGHAEPKLKWNYKMPDGSMFTDPKWANLLDAFKRVMYTYIERPLNLRKLKSGTIVIHYWRLTLMSQWMAENNYRDFADLHSEVWDSYKAYISKNRSTTKIHSSTNKSKTHDHIKKGLQLVIDIYNCGEMLNKLGIPSIPDKPLNGMPAAKAAKSIPNARESRIPPLPDDVFVTAINEAMNVLDDMAGDAIKFSNLLFKYRHIKWGDTSACRQASKYLEHDGEDDIIIFMKSDASDGLRWVNNARKVIAKTVSACMIIIQGLTGIRINELCAITLNNDETNADYPDCVHVMKSESGLTELFFIKSKLSKTVPVPVNEMWLAGSRPVDAKVLPPPIAAVIIMDNLFRLWRELHNEPHLFISYLVYNDEFCASSSKGLVRRQKAFFQGNDDLKHWNVTSHQWRKSFAKFISKCDPRMVPAIKEHFKHMSIAMTEQHYVNNDPDYRSALDEASVQNAVSIIYDGYMRSVNKSIDIGYVANIVIQSAEEQAERRRVSQTCDLKKSINKEVSEINKRLHNYSEEEKRNEIENIIRESGLRPWEVRHGTKSYGYCLFRAGVGNCLEGCEFKPFMEAPLWTVVRPDICYECNNLFVGEDHSAFWIERLKKLCAEYNEADYLNSYARVELAKSRILQCLMILKKKLGYTLVESEFEEISCTLIKLGYINAS